VNFFRVTTQLAFNVESTLAGAPKEAEEKRAQDADAQLKSPAATSAATGEKPPSKFVIGTNRSGSAHDLAASSPSGQARKSEGDNVEGEARKPKEENEWSKAWSRIVALVDLPDKGEEETTTTPPSSPVQHSPSTPKGQGSGGPVVASVNSSKREREGLRERGFKKGLEMGITRINKISKVNFKGIHLGGSSASFSLADTLSPLFLALTFHVSRSSGCSQGRRVVLLLRAGLWYPDVARGGGHLRSHLLNVPARDQTSAREKREEAVYRTLLSNC
jgi:hypothetical protein